MFQKQLYLWGHLLIRVLARLVLSCLVLPRIAWSVLVVLFSISYFYRLIWVSISHFAHIWYSPKAKQITTSVANRNGQIWGWFILGHTGKGKTRKACCASQTRQKGSLLFLKKNTVLFLTKSFTAYIHRADERLAAKSRSASKTYNNIDVMIIVSLRRFKGISVALLPRCRPNFGVIVKSKHGSRGFEISRDLEVRRRSL